VGYPVDNRCAQVLVVEMWIAFLSLDDRRDLDRW